MLIGGGIGGAVTGIGGKVTPGSGGVPGAGAGTKGGAVSGGGTGKGVICATGGGGATTGKGGGAGAGTGWGATGSDILKRSRGIPAASSPVDAGAMVGDGVSPGGDDGTKGGGTAGGGAAGSGAAGADAPEFSAALGSVSACSFGLRRKRGGCASEPTSDGDGGETGKPAADAGVEAAGAGGTEAAGAVSSSRLRGRKRN